MNITDRIILTLYTVFMAVVSAVTVLCSLDFIPHRYISAMIAGIPGNSTYCIGGLIFLLLSVRLLIANVFTSSAASLKLSDSPAGKVALGKSAIEDYVSALAQEIYGVFNVKTIADLKENGIFIRINASIEPGIVIPDTSQEIKNNVREGLKKATGVEVNSVELFFKQIKAQE